MAEIQILQPKLLNWGLRYSLILSLAACQTPGNIAPLPSSSQQPNPTDSSGPLSATPDPLASAPAPGQIIAPFTLPRLGARTLIEDEIPTEAIGLPIGSPQPPSHPTATPLPSATSDISVIEKTTFNGKLFDDLGQPLNGALVKVRSLNSQVPFEAETLTSGGTFAFNNAPSGVQIEITISKPGFASRKRVEVLKSNKQGDPNANRYDFGQAFAAGGTRESSPAPASAPPILPLPTPIMPPLPPTASAEPAYATRSSEAGALSFQALQGKTTLEKLKSQIKTHSPISPALLLPWEALRLEPLNFSNLSYVAPFQMGMGLVKVGSVAGADLYDWGGQVLLPTQPLESRPATVLTLLVEASGLMNSFKGFGTGNTAPPSLWELAQATVQTLATGLKDTDQLNLIVYSEGTQTLLSGQAFSTAQPLLQALQTQTPSGSAQLLPALNTAYALAESQHDPSKNNRLLLLGTVSSLSAAGQSAEILNLVESKAQAGLPLSVLALGELADRALLENLQRQGQGVSRQLAGLADLEALAQGLPGLLKPANRQLRFRLEAPTELSLKASSSALQGADLRWSGTLLPGEKQIFWQRFALPVGQSPSGVFRLQADYLDPAGQAQSISFEQSFASLQGQNQSPVRDAGLVNLLFRLLSGRVDQAGAQAELTPYYGAQNTTLGNEYRSLIQTWSGQ
ncbi:hypothetical protein COW36_09970 [bacterium (Candidatus Blackallbacteria) CG17_big_fil_post_rev_8_21_14_2_50_48_46]|uniref:VWFA domain-containing protein n=1 Tax=bacterium (Candidatus Blackallbacteria) CG17_big_fil_post_rev_8_21_14_2_50_48_46 TaxID=2014261 RepID=A0A2M7G584_9BACT|nr:MAG: hypothetical protein COW36_09970 [bacterium (Candidatus Blackallbacteria) CG17_big_fil_post_rev_8_21_14_2_50_48_46]